MPNKTYALEWLDLSEVAVIEQIDPRTINPPSNKTHDEIWEQMEQKLNLHYGTKLKLKF